MGGCAHQHIGAGVTFQAIRLAVTDLCGFLVDIFQQAFPGVEDAAMAADHVFTRGNFIGAGECAAAQGQGDASKRK